MVTWTTSGRAFSSIARWSVNQAGMPYRSAAASAVAGERSQMAASSTPGRVFRQARCCRAICPAPMSAAFTSRSPESGGRSPPAPAPPRSRHIARPPAASPTGRCALRDPGSASRRFTASAKAARLVLDEEVAPGDGLDPLGAQRGRDDGLAHRHGLDDLEAGAAAQPQRHHHGRGRRKVRPQVRHEAGQLDPRPGQRQERRRRPAADDLAARLGVRLGDARPDVLDEVDHAVDIGDGGEQPEVDHGAAVRRRVRGARLVVLDVRRVGNDRRAGPGHLVEQAPLVRRAAQIDAVGVAIGPQLLPPQLAPVGPGVEATAQAAAGAGELPGQVVGDLVRVHDQGGSLSPGGAWRRSQWPRYGNSRLTMSNRLARRTRSRARCSAGTVTRSRSKLRVEARDRSCSSRLARPSRP